MKKLLVLLVVFLALGAFVYFYEIEGEQKREERKQEEESLLRMDQDRMVRLEISKPDQETLVLVKEGEHWTLREPIESAADRSTVEALLRNLDSAKRERTLAGGAEKAEQYGLNKPVLTIKVQDGEQEKTVSIGGQDYTDTKVYVELSGTSDVFLTSDFLLTSADKSLKDWRSKKLLAFEREKLQALEIENREGQIRLGRRQQDWFLEAPLEERADQTTVTSLLSALEFGEVQDFVAEEATDLKRYGLEKVRVRVRMRQEGEDNWLALELGKKQEDAYFARNPDRSPVFTVKTEVFEKLTQDLWAFRDKDVIDVSQDEVARLVIERGEEKIAFRREEYKWLVEQPEEHKDKEALSYKFWYPIDDIKFESIAEGGPGETSTFPRPEVRFIATLKDGSTRAFDFAKQGDRYRARKNETGREGTISGESFEKLHFKVEEIL